MYYAQLYEDRSAICSHDVNVAFLAPTVGSGRAKRTEASARATTGR